jgi:hypothetical protein
VVHGDDDQVVPIADSAELSIKLLKNGTLEAGELSATFLPAVGVTGVSLRFRGREHLAVPGGVARLRAGGTAGLPLLAPWANRLAPVTAPPVSAR